MDQAAQKPEERSAASYAVGPPEGVEKPTATAVAPRLYAVLLAHGMGQQIPFQTIDQIASKLRELDVQGGNREWTPIGRTTRSGATRLTRLELRLKSKSKTVEVHLYEGYWAPLTEGRTTARNVIGFLAGAGLNGLRHTRGDLRRWLFGKYPNAPIPVRQVFFLLTALATAAALVIMNSAIALVAAARTLLGTRPEWLSVNLFADLTTTFNLVVLAMGSFGLVLAVSSLLRRFPSLRGLRMPMGIVTLSLFAIALTVVIMAGVGVPFLFYGHVRALTDGGQVWYQLVDAARVERFNNLFDAVGLRAAMVTALVVALRWIRRIAKGLKRDLENGKPPVATEFDIDDEKTWVVRKDKKARVATVFAALGFLFILGGFVYIGAFFLGLFDANRPDDSEFARHVAWPLLVLASAFIRLVLVQFVGDVAIYVMPYKLDAFNDLRNEIRKQVYDTARAVYAEKADGTFAYDKVIVVGHSLGSVIAYDTLNRLILEDESPKVLDATGTPVRDSLDVINRTPLFLTFGSPLDKTAFLFAVQAEGTSEAREALAGSAQPLIFSYDRRPERWVNVWSPWDIISGELDLYDYPIGVNNDPNPRRVRNERDPDATTLLLAHTEYWKNPLVVKTIYDAIEA